MWCCYCRKDVESPHRCEVTQRPAVAAWPCFAPIADKHRQGSGSGFAEAAGRRSGLRPGAP